MEPKFQDFILLETFPYPENIFLVFFVNEFKIISWLYKRD